MTGLEALGAISAIFQTVSFAREVFTLCYDFYNDKPVAFDRLSDFADKMEKATVSLKHYTMQARAVSPGTNNDALVDALGRTRDTAEQLRAEVSYVLQKRQAGSISKAIRTQFRYAKKKSTIAALRSNLEDCDKHTKLLLARHNIEQSDAIMFQQTQGFSDLSDLVKDRVQQLVQQQARASEAAAALSADITNLSTNVTQSHTKTREHINDTLALQAQAASNDEAHHQLLESLEFPDMWQRQNQILDNEDASFEGAFFRRAVSDEGPKSSEAAASLNSETADDIAETSSREMRMHIVQKAINGLREWIHTGTTPFWINGHAGSGKSTLVKFLAAQEHKHSIDHPDLQKEILTHYFWKAGNNEMQQSKKGYLCSIIYQLLQNDPKRTEGLFKRDRDVARKKRISDWSIAELQKVFSRLITTSSTTFVIFIDGLDEMTEDEDLYGLLESLRDHKSLPQCRFCVSSRPEYIIQKHLSEYPTIRIQELTYESMIKYTTAKLKPAVARTKWEESRIQRLLSLTVSRAEGIFLWLVLVTDILRRSLDMNKDYGDILQRLDGLPTRLEDLFVDMWKRMGDDFASDQKIAASYINVAVMNMRLMNACRHVEEGIYDDMITTDQLQLGTALFVVSPDMSDNLFGDRNNATLRDQIEWLQARRDEMVSHCLGLLICAEERWSGESQFCLDLLFHQTVSFVHRSAFDFFTETKAGQAICSKSAISNEECYLLRAKAFVLQTRFTRRLVHINPDCRGNTFSTVALPAAVALSEAVSLSRDNVTRAKCLLKDVCETVYYERPDMVTDFAGIILRIKHMLELLIAPPTSIASTEIGAIIFFDYWAGHRLLNAFRRDLFPHPPQVLVQKMLAAGAYPHDPILSRTRSRMVKTSAFIEFLRYLWFELLDERIVTRFMRELKTSDLNGYLVALGNFLEVNPSLAGTERLACWVTNIDEPSLPDTAEMLRIHAGSVNTFSVLLAWNDDGDDFHASSGHMHIAFAVDSGWLCRDILTRCRRIKQKGRFSPDDNLALPKVIDQLEHLMAKQCYQTDKGFTLLNMHYCTRVEPVLYSRLEFDQGLNQAAEDYLTNHILPIGLDILRESDAIQMAARTELFQTLLYLFWSDNPEPFAEWKNSRTGLADLSSKKIYEWPNRSNMILRKDFSNAISGTGNHISIRMKFYPDGGFKVYVHN